ncbi:MAG: antibiotic biosynthesis monooxygenase [Candidatus Aminicenantaceae bacterium]
MFARVTTVYLRKDLIDKALKLFKESVIPAAKKQEGFKSISFLLDRESGKMFVVSFWDSKENIEANEESRYYLDQILKSMVTFSTDPFKESFEVVLQT